MGELTVGRWREYSSGSETHGTRAYRNYDGIFARLSARKSKNTQSIRYRFCFMQPQWEIADVLRKVDLSHQNFTIHQEKTLRALTLCRTSALGGHVDVDMQIKITV